MTRLFDHTQRTVRQSSAGFSLRGFVLASTKIHKLKRALPKALPNMVFEVG
jgi:hypothetical protein